MDNTRGETEVAHAGDDFSPQDGFLFIGELAKLTATDPKTIRFYERVELISPPRHGRFRTYLASDVRRLKNVLTLRRLGVPIAHLDLLKNRQDELQLQIQKTNTALESLVA